MKPQYLFSLPRLIPPTLELQGPTYVTVSLTIPYIHGILMQLDEVILARDSNGDDLNARNPYLACVARNCSYRMEYSEASQDSAEMMALEEEARSQFSSPTKGYKRRIFVSRRTTEHIIDEVDEYLSEPREHGKCDLIEFYKDQQKSFPIIYQIAKDYLIIPAMSAPHEALFSRMGNVVVKNRNRINPTAIRKLAILKSRSLREQEKPEEANDAVPGDQQSTEEVSQDPFLSLDDAFNSDEGDLPHYSEAVEEEDLTDPFQI